jgi:hypothetical protein
LKLQKNGFKKTGTGFSEVRFELAGVAQERRARNEKALISRTTHPARATGAHRTMDPKNRFTCIREYKTALAN